MVLTAPFPSGRRYIYIVRDTCQLTPDVSKICLEMYVSCEEYDEIILSKQKRISENLNIPISVDVYQEHTDNTTMLLLTTYSFNVDNTNKNIEVFTHQ
jgi:hypothetical protein